MRKWENFSSSDDCSSGVSKQIVITCGPVVTNDLVIKFRPLIHIYIYTYRAMLTFIFVNKINKGSSLEFRIPIFTMKKSFNRFLLQISSKHTPKIIHISHLFILLRFNDTKSLYIHAPLIK